MLSTIRSSNSMSGYFSATSRRDRQEQAVGELHDVGLVDGRDLLAAELTGVVEGVLDDPPRALDRDRLDRDAGVVVDLAAREQALMIALQLQRLGRVLLELDAGVEVLGVLAHDDEVDVLVLRPYALVALARAYAGVEVQGLAQSHVHAAEAGADGGRDRALDGDLVLADRLDDARPGAACRRSS